MNWNHVPLFLAVAENGTLAGAARSQGVNHSTAFRQLNALENEVGSRLFERLSDGYVLTAVGEDLLPHARAARDAVDAMNRSAAGRDQELSGDVRLTTAANLAEQHLAPMLADLQLSHPGIRVELIVSDSDYDLGRREADLALRATPTPPEYLIARKVVDLDWVLVASPAYLSGRPRPADVTELSGHRLIGADQGFQRLAAFQHLHQRIPREQFAATTNSLNTMAAMAESGLGIALVPTDQVSPGLERLFVFEPGIPGSLWLLTHPDLRRVARIRAVSQFIFDRMSRDPRLKFDG